MAMSSAMATPYCESLIALEYYDGPTTGVGWLSSGETIYFKLIGWDQEQWHRLFLTIPIESSIAKDLQSSLGKDERQKLPIWVPNARNDVPQAATIVAIFHSRIEDIVKRTKNVSIVESHDLVHGSAYVNSLSGLDSTLALSYARENRVLILPSRHMIEEYLIQLRS